MIRLVAVCITLLLSCMAGQAFCQDDPPDQEWRWYGADLASTKYAPLDQITAENIDQLEIAWRWTSPDEAIRSTNRTLWTWKNESTPIMIDGVLYTSTSMSLVAALDATTGKTKWVYNTQSYLTGSAPNHYHHRGVAYWEDGEDRRIFIGTGDAYLIALDAETGQPISEFGEGGRIDLTQGLRRPIDRLDYGVSSPPIICGGTVMVGATITDYPRNKVMPPGDMRGFDVRTGEQRWVFESIPQGDALGVATWGQDSWKHVGNTNVWTMMSCDEELGFVYLPFGTPSNDYYGADRPGDNLFAESLVALHAETGTYAWHFQMVHHGIWDYDLPAAPNLVDLTVDGRSVKAVAQVSKQGFVYVLDRVTGAPVWPIEERPVAPSTLAGEHTAPTQPFPTRPAPFDRQGITEDDVIDFTPALRQAALDILAQYDVGPLFTPPTKRGMVMLPGVAGGASWAGAAVDPERGVLYVPSITLPTLVTVVPAQTNDGYHPFMGIAVPGTPAGPQGLPLFKPPYGRVTAIDLNTGEHLWMQASGEGPRNHPALQDLDVPPLGWPRRTFVLLTRSLLFTAQEGLTGYRGVSPRLNADEITTVSQDPTLRALNPQDGRLLTEIPLPENATGTPITYMVAGIQYLVVPIGGASQPAELVALRLP